MNLRAESELLSNKLLQRTRGHRGRTVRAGMCARAGAESARCPAAEHGR